MTIYCGCKYAYLGEKLVPKPSSCGYEPRIAVTKKGKPNARAVRIEWEHAMPATELLTEIERRPITESTLRSRLRTAKSRGVEPDWTLYEKPSFPASPPDPPVRPADAPTPEV